MRFIDSNIFIYVLDRHPRFGATSKKILERVEGGEEAVTSTLVVEEVCVYLIEEGRREEIPKFVEVLSGYGFLSKHPFLFEDVVTAREMLRTHEINWNDLIVVAQMQREDIKEIYSNDSDFDEIEWVDRIFE